MPQRYTQRILDHVADRRYRPATIDQLADELGIPDDLRSTFNAAVQQLADQNQILLGSSGTVALPPPGPRMAGTFRRHERGFGFLVPDTLTQHGDLFIPAEHTAGALTGDQVLAQVVHEPHRAKRTGKSPYSGRIIRITQRADHRYVGTLHAGPRVHTVVVDNNLLPDPVLIRDPRAHNAKPGDKVVLELVKFPSDVAPAEGVITEVLGRKGTINAETLAVIRAHHLPDEFPPQVLDQARDAAQHLPDLATTPLPPGREDLRDLLICTIDPPTAKDFDDAISIVQLDPDQQPDRAAYELGVHIADVSHFVTPGSPLDEEAYQRGNSTYLPQRVIPMLPEVLSNGVCSLQEGVDRFCKSVFIRYTDDARVVAQRFAATVIRSAKRMTYLEAQAVIDGETAAAKTHAATDTPVTKPIAQALKRMDRLARIIRKRRFADGMITLNLPAAELVFDDDGRVIDAQPEDDAFTHTIIEMFMVEANEAAALTFNRFNRPMIRRTHPDPDAHDLKQLHSFTRVAGFTIPANPSRQELQGLLNAVRGTPTEHTIHLAVLKTLSRAEYAPALVGHFALASEHYTHFTSPIRRYPDLVVHRALAAVLEQTAQSPKRKKLDDDPRLPDEASLQTLGRHCSDTERNSESAERDLREYLILELLAQQVGDDHDGTVTGVTQGGLFVQIDRYLIDGFVPADDLPPTSTGERWRYDRRTGRFTAARSGASLSLGQRFNVRITSVNPPARQLNLAIIDQETPKDTAKRRKPKRHKDPDAKKSTTAKKLKPKPKNKPKLKSKPKQKKQRKKK